MKKKMGPCKDCGENRKYHHGHQCHDCYKAYQNQRYAKNTDEYNARSASYYAGNRDSILRKVNKRAAGMREELREYGAEWRSKPENKARKAITDKHYRDNNPVQVKKNKQKHAKTPKGLLNKSYHGAIRRSLYWDLNLQVFEHFEGAWCFYCEWIAKVTHRPKKLQPVTGLDRWNNVDYLLGYRWGNVVPCCEEHNRLKSYRNGTTFLKLIDPYTRRVNCPYWTGTRYISGPSIELTYEERLKALFWIADNAKPDKRRKSIDPKGGCYLT